MWNTCSIGRRWKPREGWSRPVLTGDRGTFFRSCWVGSRPVVVSRWMARNAVSCGHDDAGKAFCLRPLSGSRTATIGIVVGSVCRPILVVGRYIVFAVVMAQVRRPVPFRTRKLRPGCGDGTALERVWESSTPPHSTLDLLVESPWGIPGRSFFILLGVPAGRNAPETPIFCLLCRPAGRSTLPEVSPSGLSRCSASGLFHAPGDLRAPRDFRDFRGASCAYPMVE